MTKLPSAAFEYYFELGCGRSYQQVADHFGVCKKTVTTRAGKEGWQGRIEAREHEARAVVEKRAVETLADVTERHLKFVRAVQRKAVEGLQKFGLESAMECVRALDIAVKQERLILGEPTERTETDMVAIIKREGERWLTPAR
ncbi:MAG: hypothetical protein KDB53_00380 [Planctomycetes bacterium]|nr:hypothetical protein [Planctomycetota bacterium]